MAHVYKIMHGDEWAAARGCGRYRGSRHDMRDGFIHFSTAAQMRETAAKHFTGQQGLVLLQVDAEGFGGSMKWEPSRGGDLFPHLYGVLPTAAVTRVWDLPLGPDGAHVFPAEAI